MGRHSAPDDDDRPLLPPVPPPRGGVGSSPRPSAGPPPMVCAAPAASGGFGGLVVEVAQWTALTGAGGVIGGVFHEQLKAVAHRVVNGPASAAPADRTQAADVARNHLFDHFEVQFLDDPYREELYDDGTWHLFFEQEGQHYEVTVRPATNRWRQPRGGGVKSWRGGHPAE